MPPITISLFHPAFEEIAIGLSHGVAELGLACRLEIQRIPGDGPAIVLGPERIADWSAVPPGAILFNFEQLGVPGQGLPDAYLEALSRHPVWDYSARNVARLAAAGIADVELVRIGYVPALTRIPAAAAQDIDVLFYGMLSPRRAQMIAALERAGLAVTVLRGVTGPARDQMIARAKVVLNLHRFDSHIFEIVRVSYLLANRKAVVCEVAPDTDIEDELRAAVEAAPYEGLAEACVRLTQDDDARRSLENRGFAVFAARRQSDFLRHPLGRYAPAVAARSFR